MPLAKYYPYFVCYVINNHQMPHGNAENAIKFQYLDYLCQILIKKVLFFPHMLTTPQPLNQTAEGKKAACGICK